MKIVQQPKNAVASRTKGRPREFEMAEVLSKSVLIFCEHGYRGTSIELLERGTGLTAGSLYKAFQGKRQIFATSFDHYVSKRRELMSDLISKASTGREELIEILRFYIDSASGVEGRRGCLVVAGLVEASGLDEETRSSLMVALEAVRTSLAKTLRKGQKDGSISANLPVNHCADLLLSLVQGFRVVGKLRDPSNRETLIELALKILE